MAKLLKLRRGTTTQHSSFTGAEGEVTIDTTKDTAVVHDGSQAGGRPLAREDMTNVSSASIAGRLGTDAIATTKIAAGALPTDVTIAAGNIGTDAVIQAKIADEAIDEARLQISNAGSNGQYLQKQSGNTGGLTWGTVDLTTLSASNLTSGTIPDARFPSTLPAVSGANLTGVQPFASGTKMLFQQTSAPTGWTKITSSVDNKALRLVSGTVGSGGNASFTGAFASYTPAGSIAATANATASFSGSVSGTSGNSTANTSSVSTSGNVNNHTLSTSQMPSHSHSFSRRAPGSYASYGGTATNNEANAASNGNTNNTGGGGSHSHGFSGSSHSHSVNNHTHSFSANFSGNTGNHTHTSGAFSGTARDFAVQYIDVIVASKD